MAIQQRMHIPKRAVAVITSRGMGDTLSQPLWLGTPRSATAKAKKTAGPIKPRMAVREKRGVPTALACDIGGMPASADDITGGKISDGYGHFPASFSVTITSPIGHSSVESGPHGGGEFNPMTNSTLMRSPKTIKNALRLASIRITLADGGTA